LRLYISFLTDRFLSFSKDMKFKKATGIILLALIFFLALELQAKDYTPLHSLQNSDSAFVKGADVSFIPQIEDLGGVYQENGVPEDPLIILKRHGINYIRLKLWHSPTDGYNNLKNILMMAKRIKANEMKLLLNFHYSDTWADPGKQYKPAAWDGLDFDVLKDSVYTYTKTVIQALNAQQTLPDMVQIGNEITPGMLWNDGRVGGAYNTSQQWSNLGELINSAIQGIRESCDAGDSVRIMIHIDRGGDNGGCRWYFDNLLDEGVEFDVIGLSFYPWWHGTLDDVQSNLNDLATRYGKDIIIVETAYPWTLQWFDSHGNIVGSSDQLHSGYPATVDGQAAFLRDLIKIVRNVPNQKGLGLFYWAPEYISVEPIGSPWENNALFDFYGNVLSSIDVFLEETPDTEPINVTVRLNTSTLMDTLQEYHFVQIRGGVSGISYNTLPDGKKITWDSESEIILENVNGDYWETTFQMYSEDELSFKFWSGFNQTQGTFQRLGWEGPICPYGGLYGNRRVIVAGARDTTINVQYYNSTGDTKAQFWQPFETKDDSVAVYFRVNMGKVTASGRFDPALNGPVAVRGDEISSGGSLSRDESRVILEREDDSVNNGSFWSGAVYIPGTSIVPGNALKYKFYIENDSGDGWENGIADRSLTFSESLLRDNRDTTLHWVYFNETGTVNISEKQQQIPMYFQLNQNYPNPFNNLTQISYRLDKPSYVNLRIYDIEGRLVSTLVGERQPTGRFTLLWDAQKDDDSALVSGIYSIYLITDYGVQSRKILLLK